MIITTPLGFWQRYKDEIAKLNPTLAKYGNKTTWTELALIAASNAIASDQQEPIREPLTVSREYFRIDVIGEEKFAKQWDWSLRVAFEHENEYAQMQWKQEMCKLAHVVADLRVLAGYYDSSEKEVESILQDQVNTLRKNRDRITRVPNSQWLFIFGPANTVKDAGGKFLTYTLSGTSVEAFCDGDPLIPLHWGD
jgi:hypothetical protein